MTPEQMKIDEKIYNLKERVTKLEQFFYNEYTKMARSDFIKTIIIFVLFSINVYQFLT